MAFKDYFIKKQEEPQPPQAEQKNLPDPSSGNFGVEWGGGTYKFTAPSSGENLPNESDLQPSIQRYEGILNEVLNKPELQSYKDFLDTVLEYNNQALAEKDKYELAYRAFKRLLPVTSLYEAGENAVQRLQSEKNEFDKHLTDKENANQNLEKEIQTLQEQIKQKQETLNSSKTKIAIEKMAFEKVFTKKINYLTEQNTKIKNYIK